MKPTMLYVTDLHYQAKGRGNYHDEDISFSSQLSRHFDLVLCQPTAAYAFLDSVDIVFFRNTGPVFYFIQEYEAFKIKVNEVGVKIFNELKGKGDMIGKQYLVELTKRDYPVIPSVDKQQDFGLLLDSDKYLVKPKLGADSIGIRQVSKKEIDSIDFSKNLVQPLINFIYEVSFYFINHSFQYALYAPNPEKRWELEFYEATDGDMKFAQRFIEWNNIDYGIQRIDACRTSQGDLLLMEVEDLNPYLSLDLLTDKVRDLFIGNVTNALIQFIES